MNTNELEVPLRLIFVKPLQSHGRFTITITTQWEIIVIFLNDLSIQSFHSLCDLMSASMHAIGARHHDCHSSGRTNDRFEVHEEHDAVDSSMMYLCGHSFRIEKLLLININILIKSNADVVVDQVHSFNNTGFFLLINAYLFLFTYSDMQ